MTNEIPKFPRRDSINMECSMIIGDYEKWRVKTIKALKGIRNSPKNLSLEEGHDVVPDLIKEFLEALK